MFSYEIHPWLYLFPLIDVQLLLLDMWKEQSPLCHFSARASIHLPLHPERNHHGYHHILRYRFQICNLENRHLDSQKYQKHKSHNKTIRILIKLRYQSPKIHLPMQILQLLGHAALARAWLQSGFAYEHHASWSLHASSKNGRVYVKSYSKYKLDKLALDDIQFCR